MPKRDKWFKALLSQKEFDLSVVTNMSVTETLKRKSFCLCIAKTRTR
jgi:hypothetical protein